MSLIGNTGGNGKNLTHGRSRFRKILALGLAFVKDGPGKVSYSCSQSIDATERMAFFSIIH